MAGTRGALDEAAAEGIHWQVESIETSAQDRNGRRVAAIDSISARVTSTAQGLTADLVVHLGGGALSIDGTIEGEPLTVRIDQERASGRGTVEGEPFEFEIDLATYEGFARGFGESIELSREGDCLLITLQGETQWVCEEELGFQGSSAALDIQEDWESITSEAGTPGLTVVERDGGWYVSGFPTWACLIVDVLKATDPDELDRLIDSYGELIESLDPSPTL